MLFQPLLLTLQLIVVAVTIAAVIGIVGAWAASVLQHCGRPGRLASKCFLLAMVSAVAMPLVLHAAAWEATAGKFGWWMITQSGPRTDDSGVYGMFTGLVASGWIHGLFGAAVVALATWYGTSQVPAVVIEQSRFDFGPLGSWWKVRLPIAAPWVVTGVLATAVLAAAEMSVVDLYGYVTAADAFYLYYAVEPSLPRVMVTCALPLALAGSLAVWLLISRRRVVAVQTPAADAAIDQQSTPRLLIALAAGGLLLIVAGVALVPLTGLLVKSGHQVTVEHAVVRASWSLSATLEHVWQAPGLFAQEFRWTGLLALISGVSATILAWPLAMFGRQTRRAEQVIDVATIISVAIPGPIVGMGIVHLFQIPVPGFQYLYGQTVLPAVIALMFRAVPVAYWILRSGYRGVEDAVVDAARIDFQGWSRVWWVDRPLMAWHLMLAGFASAVVASGDVAAILPVIPAGVSTVGTRLFGLLHSGARYQEASLAIWYVGVVVLISAVWLRQFDRRSIGRRYG